MKPKILSRIEHIIIQIFTYEIIIIDKYKVSIHFSYHIQTIGRNLRNVVSTYSNVEQSF